jgi:hypothetical protein
MPITTWTTANQTKYTEVQMLWRKMTVRQLGKLVGYTYQGRGVVDLHDLLLEHVLHALSDAAQHHKHEAELGILRLPRRGVGGRGLEQRGGRHDGHGKGDDPDAHPHVPVQAVVQHEALQQSGNDDYSASHHLPNAWAYLI